MQKAGPKAAADSGRPEQAPSEPPQVFRTIADARSAIGSRRERHKGASIGYVPTMGFFHEGHLSLMRAAAAENDFVVISIFVNPTQFGADEDFDLYPRDFEKDLAVAAGAGVDLVFAPDSDEMYPEGSETTIDVGSIAEGLCGPVRPGHFTGVATVVAKLFNIVAPDRAYFGQKDAQQVAVIKRMTKDLDFDVEIRVCPTVREPDGLAMSSRNTYLTPEEREQSTVLYEALTKASEAVASGETSSKKVLRMIKRMIGANYLTEYDYARIVDPDTLKNVAEIEGPVLAALAARVGKTRLIDNMILTPGG